MITPILYADFNNADVDGRLRLNCAGTMKDLAEQAVTLAPGMHVVLHDEELEADGKVEFSATENVWVGIIDWSQVRQRTANASAAPTLPDA